jgi:GcvH upstream region-like protein
MLHLFRRYEKVIYIGITTVTIISFVFFGTYGTLNTGHETKDEPLFEAVDGSVVKRSEVERLSRFLSSDLFESVLSGSPLGANFLNDGVIRKDFIESGVGPLLIRYLGSEDVISTKERHYRPYHHPESTFVSSEMIWNQFAPRLKTAFDVFKTGEFKTIEDAFRAKANLYLMESTFPHPMLRQVLAFQLQQQKWLKPDPNLNQTDLALFGYHTTRDWFGDNFLKRCAEVILNVAKKAEFEGYRVTLEAAEADLLRNGEHAYHAHRRPEVAKSIPDYVRQELRLLGFDQGEAVKLWRSVLMFRTYLKDHTTSVVNEGTLLKPFFEGEHEEIVVETHTLQTQLALGSFKDLLQVESYLEGVALGETYPFPREWKESFEVAQSTPELALKKYKVEVKELSLKQLGALIPLKEVWAYEESEGGKAELMKLFPTMALGGDLSPETQKLVDQKARLQLIERHPLKVDEALQKSTPKEMNWNIYKSGGKSPLKGIESQEIVDKLEAGNTHFVVRGDDLIYEVSVVDRPEHWEIANLQQAKEAGQLDRLVNQRLQKKYEEVKASLFQNEDGSIKAFAEVKDELAEATYRGLIHKLKRVAPQVESLDLLAGYRFVPYLETGVAGEGQFAFVVKEDRFLKGQETPLPFNELVQLPKGESSSVFVKRGLPLYVKVTEQGIRNFSLPLSTSLAKANRQIEEAALQAFFGDLLVEISGKGAFSRSDV